MLTLAASCLLLVSVAAAHDGDAAAEELLDSTLGDRAVDVGDGLYEIPVRGDDLLTHGPDAKPATEERGSSVGFRFGDAERSPVCGGDYYQHVLYARPDTGADAYPSSVEPIRAAIRRMNAVLNQDSLASGGPSADYRVHCADGGEIEVGSVTTSGTTFGSIVNAARKAGFDRPNVDYTIFFDGSAGGACGIGSYWDDDRPTVDNYNNDGGSYAVTYRGCWYGATPMHENGHSQGAVQYSAPYSTGTGGHCWDESDVMCYSPDGGDLHQEGTILRCSDRTYFDCGFDTYFDSAPEPGEWLTEHWNIGSPLNRFVAFGAGGQEEEPEPAPAPEPVVENLPPGASFESGCRDLSCTFADTSSDPDGTVVTRRWEVDGGELGGGTRIEHAFDDSGSHQVRLTVTDDAGASASTTRTVEVRAPSIQRVRRLRRGIALTDTASAAGEQRLYVIRVPRARRLLRVRVAGPECAAAPCNPDLNLYVRHRAVPTTTAHHCASERLGSVERCRIRARQKGLWRIAVRTAQGAAGAQFTIEADHSKWRRPRR